jgi:hypothetical protein
LDPPVVVAAPPLELGGLPVSLPEQEMAPLSPAAARLTVAKLNQVFRETSENVFIVPAVYVVLFKASNLSAIHAPRWSQKIARPANSLKPVPIRTAAML